MPPSSFWGIEGMQAEFHLELLAWSGIKLNRVCVCVCVCVGGGGGGGSWLAIFDRI